MREEKTIRSKCREEYFATHYLPQSTSILRFSPIFSVSAVLKLFRPNPPRPTAAIFFAACVLWLAPLLGASRPEPASPNGK